MIFINIIIYCIILTLNEIDTIDIPTPLANPCPNGPVLFLLLELYFYRVII